MIKRYQFLLANGGELFVNRMGSHWTVDVFDGDSAPDADPTYHAFYDSEAEALADADLWAKWAD